jgi:endonuclease G
VFKAVVDPGKQEAAAWLAPNDDGGEYQVISIAALERRVGFNLFPKLPDAAKQHAMELPEPRIRSRK